MTINPLRIAFMGTPDFVIPCVQALKDSGHDLVCLYTQPPREKGRHKKLEHTPVHDYALKKGIQFRHPENFKNKKDIDLFRNLKLDVAIVAAYGLLLPEDILKAPKHGCINIHPSLLPRWRGPSPIQFAIWKGDEQTGVTIMSLEKAMDSGPILAQQSVAIADRTFEQLNTELWATGTEMLLRVLDDLARTGTLKPTPQDHERATRCYLLTKEDGRINWNQTANEIDRQIRGLNPWPGTWCTDQDGRRMKILHATPLPENSNAQSGTILSGGKIACGQNTVLQLKKVQPENKNLMDVLAAMNGGYLAQGKMLQ